VPLLADLAAMRNVRPRWPQPKTIEPLVPVDLVAIIDHGSITSAVRIRST